MRHLLRAVGRLRGRRRRRSRPHLKPGAIVSDTGSVKGAVIEQMAPHLPPGVHLIPGHPVAGTEYSGPDAGFAELFENRWCIFTPPEGADRGALARLREFWEGLGSQGRDDERRASRPRARDDQPRAASDRLQHRRHGRRPRGGDRVGGDQVLGRRLSRLHAHRRLRPDHVARRVPSQPEGGAGGARPLHRGPRLSAAGDPLGRGRQALRTVQREPATCAARSSSSGRRRPSPISAAAAASRRSNHAATPNAHRTGRIEASPYRSYDLMVYRNSDFPAGRGQS